MELRYASIAVISSGSKTNSGIAGWPAESPSASDSASSSMGYLRDKVRNGGAAECGLSPVRAMAWQCAHRHPTTLFPALPGSTPRRWQAARALLALFTLAIAAQTIDTASAAPRQHCYG